jgi:hypothetical protein
MLACRNLWIEPQLMAASDRPAGAPHFQQQLPANMFRPPLDDRVRARRAGARLLVLTRQALNAMAATRAFRVRAYMASRLVGECRALLSQLRGLDIGGDRSFGLIAARVRQRLVQIRSLLEMVHDVSVELRLIEAELAALSGDLAAAHEGLEQLMWSIRAIQQRDVRDEVAIRYLDLCIACMASAAGFLSFLEYLVNRLPHGRLSQRFRPQIRLMAVHAAILREAGLWQSALVIQLSNRILRTRPRSIAALVADAGLQRAGLAVVRRELRSRARSDRPARVIRAMGGLGDLLMMTPGLRALSRRTDRRIELAIPRHYLPLFETNPFVTALSLEDLPGEWYREGPIIDLTDCPASVVESRTAPKVTVNRIEIFARALGVGGRELRRQGMRPLFEPPSAGRQRAEAWLAASAAGRSSQSRPPRPKATGPGAAWRRPRAGSPTSIRSSCSTTSRSRRAIVWPSLTRVSAWPSGSMLPPAWLLRATPGSSWRRTAPSFTLRAPATCHASASSGRPMATCARATTRAALPFRGVPICRACHAGGTSGFPAC